VPDRGDLQIKERRGTGARIDRNPASFIPDSSFTSLQKRTGF
jgi:hypothetical protein